MARTVVRTVSVAILVALALGRMVRADDQTTYLTRDEALRLAFPSANRFDVVTERLPGASRAALEARLGEPLASDTIEVHRAWVGGDEAETLLGRAVENDDIGKYRPITYLVAVDTQGRVVRVELLVYRESHGGAVHGRAFLTQYEGKTATDSIRVGKDITSISGATLSAQAVSKGVKRTLLILDAIDRAHADPTSPSVRDESAGTGGLASPPPSSAAISGPSSTLPVSGPPSVR